MSRPWGADYLGPAQKPPEINTFPRCHFAVRYPADGSGWYFVSVAMAAPGGITPHIPLEHPPVPGDLVVLHSARGDEPLEGGPVFKVVERMWTHPQYGSGSWPGGTDKPLDGPLLEIIVEPAEGLYRDEAP